MSDNTTAAELFNQRAKSWGEATHTHARIALVWEGIGDHQPETAGLAALKMAGMKLVRAAINPDDPDSFNDAEVYIDIARQCFGLPSKLKPEKKPEVEATCGTSGRLVRDKKRAPCADFYCANEVTVHNHGVACTETCRVCLGMA